MLKTFIGTLLTVFIAELGDKTQLTTVLMASKSESPKSVFIGSAVALIASSALAVCLGLYMKKNIPEQFIRYGGALIFIIIGVYMLFDR